MRGNNLKKHVKRHERENEDNVVTKAVHDEKTEDNVVTNGEQRSCSSGSDEELEKRVIDKNKEFNRKIELGQEF